MDKKQMAGELLSAAQGLLSDALVSSFIVRQAALPDNTDAIAGSFKSLMGRYWPKSGMKWLKEGETSARGGLIVFNYQAMYNEQELGIQVRLLDPKRNFLSKIKMIVEVSRKTPQGEESMGELHASVNAGWDMHMICQSAGKLFEKIAG